MNKLKKLFGIIRDDFRESWQQTKQMWVGWHISRMKRKAEKLRISEKSQIFVVKMEGEIRFITKEWFKAQRQHGKFSKSFTTDKLKKVSFYHTAPYKK